MINKKLYPIMLPTEQKTKLIVYDGNKFAYNKEIFKLKQGINQHLYLVSDGKIKEGNWVYSSHLNLVNQFNNEGAVFHANKNSDKCKKIVATTDTSLTYYSDKEDHTGFSGDLQLLQIPQSFIEAWSKSNGSIKEIEVEVDRKSFYDATTYLLKEIVKIKTNENNEVVIVKILTDDPPINLIKDSDTIKDMRKAFQAGRNYQMGVHHEYNGGEKHDYPNFDKWLEKNFKKLE